MDVTIKGSGQTSNIEAQVDASFNALRVSLKPQDYNAGGIVGGHYAAAFATGSVTGRTAADVLLGWRWGSPAMLCVIKRISAAATIVTAQAATVQEMDWDVIRASNFTVNYTGGSSVKQTFNATSHKLRSTMAPSELTTQGDVYVAATAAATGQTATLDSLPFGYACPPIAGNTATYLGNLGGPVDLWKQDKMAEHPIVFDQGEGFAIRVGTTQGATVAVKSIFVVEWMEVAVY